MKDTEKTEEVVEATSEGMTNTEEETEEVEVNEFTGDLEQFDDDYSSVKAAETKEFEKVPNGKYQATIAKIKLARAKNTGAKMLKWELIVIGGKYMGCHLFRNNMIETKENLSWLKKDLECVGIKLVKFSHLPGHLDEMLDILVEVSVKNYIGKNKQEQTNVYLQKKLDIALPAEYIEYLKKDGSNDSASSSANVESSNLPF